MALDFPNRKHYLDWRYKSLVAKSYKNCEEDEEIGSYDCYVKADTSQELFRKLEKLDSDLLVIPHGSAWRVTSPPFSSWDLHLSSIAHNSSMIRLIAAYSGHGNS